MRIRSTILVVGLVSVCCATTSQFQGWNTLALTAVEKQQPGAPTEKFPVTGDAYEDQLLKITWKYNGEALTFSLANNRSSSLRVLWDETALVSLDGKSHRIIHNGVRYIDSGKPMSPTVVPAGSSIDEAVMPADGVDLQTGPRSYWSVTPLVARNATRGATEDEVRSKLAPGGTARVLLPIEVEAIVTEYTFTVNVIGHIEPPASPAK